MQRIPEPELMDSAAQTAAYAAADFSESNSLFVSSFLQRFPDSTLARYRAGRLSSVFPTTNLEPHHGWRIDGLDAGENMLKLARRRLETEAQALEIDFRLSYLPDPSLEAGAWDALVSNSLLHHLPEPHALWTSIGNRKSCARISTTPCSLPTPSTRSSISCGKPAWIRSESTWPATVTGSPAARCPADTSPPLPVEFHKMHGAGNDFVLVDARKQPFEPTPELARAIADRRFGAIA